MKKLISLPLLCASLLAVAGGAYAGAAVKVFDTTTDDSRVTLTSATIEGGSLVIGGWDHAIVDLTCSAPLYMTEGEAFGAPYPTFVNARDWGRIHPLIWTQYDIVNGTVSHGTLSRDTPTNLKVQQGTWSVQIEITPSSC